MRSTALVGGSAWASRMTPAARLTWMASGRADLMTALGAGEDSTPINSNANAKGVDHASRHVPCKSPS